MQERHMDGLMSEAFSKLNSDEIADIIKAETDNLPDGMRTPYSEEITDMIEYAKELKAETPSLSKESVRDLVAKKFKVEILPNTVAKEIAKNVPHKDGNRATRRAKVDKPQPTNVVGKAHRNNRKNTKARKNNKLFLKLAEFEMSVGAKRHR